MVADLEFDHVVNDHYVMLYRFALSLTRKEPDALDLTQETFAIWATKGKQLRDATKLKTWLCTTLYREFLAGRRRAKKFPHYEIGIVENDLPTVPPRGVTKVDGSAAMDALMSLDEKHRAPLLLFYVEDRSYQEIAEILDLPIGTVMSRLARGKEALRQKLTTNPDDRP